MTTQELIDMIKTDPDGVAADEALAAFLYSYPPARDGFHALAHIGNSDRVLRLIDIHCKKWIVNRIGFNQHRREWVVSLQGTDGLVHLLPRYADEAAATLPRALAAAMVKAISADRDQDGQRLSAA